MKRSLTCTCCGSAAGRWEQHWNQDTGYGLCQSCRDWIWDRNHPPVTRQEFRQTYGTPGINYAAWPDGHPAAEPAKTHTLWGRVFTVAADFDNAAEANQYMTDNPGTGLLAEHAGRFLIADLSDKGVPIPRTSSVSCSHGKGFNCRQCWPSQK